MSSNPNQLFLLADHVKLSLLERQRARSLDLDRGGNGGDGGGDSKDGHIARSLDQFREGLAALRQEQTRLEEAGDEDGSLTISDALPGLQKQFNDLQSQFHGFSSPATDSTLTQPNDPTLGPDFAHAQQQPQTAAASATTTAGAARPKKARSGSKTVRFSDNPSSSSSSSAAANTADDQQRQDLFGNRYRDNPNGDDDSAGYRDAVAGLSNAQVHAYHQQVLDQQDSQLDALGASISRQRELSLRMGDELDGHAALLDDLDGQVDGHAGRLRGARNRVGRIARAAGESRQMVAIVVLIVVLVLLIALLK
ncbi:v-SNARE [Xylariaceae sp. FL0804]|nr:v-SNARE [Xylariaceae sp. FL0804]